MPPRLACTTCRLPGDFWQENLWGLAECGIARCDQSTGSALREATGRCCRRGLRRLGSAPSSSSAKDRSDRVANSPSAFGGKVPAEPARHWRPGCETGAPPWLLWNWYRWRARSPRGVGGLGHLFRSSEVDSIVSSPTTVTRVEAMIFQSILKICFGR